MKKTIFCFIALSFYCCLLQAATLPSTGKATPTPEVLAGPGYKPPDPGETVPLEHGVAYILGLSCVYLFVKRKKEITCKS